MPDEMIGLRKPDFSVTLWDESPLSVDSIRLRDLYGAAESLSVLVVAAMDERYGVGKWLVNRNAPADRLARVTAFYPDRRRRDPLRRVKVVYDALVMAGLLDGSAPDDFALRVGIGPRRIEIEAWDGPRPSAFITADDDRRSGMVEFGLGVVSLFDKVGGLLELVRPTPGIDGHVKWYNAAFDVCNQARVLFRQNRGDVQFTPLFVSFYDNGIKAADVEAVASSLSDIDAMLTHMRCLLGAVEADDGSEDLTACERLCGDSSGLCAGCKDVESEG